MYYYCVLFLFNDMKTQRFQFGLRLSGSGYDTMVQKVDIIFVILSLYWNFKQ